MNLNETVDYFLNKPKFGIDNYQPEYLNSKGKKGLAFRQQKFKRESFMVTVPKLTKINPGPDKYNLTSDWSKDHPVHTQKIVKGAVNSFLDQIVRKNKSPEKCTPSPLVYHNQEAWRHTAQKAKGT